MRPNSKSFQNKEWLYMVLLHVLVCPFLPPVKGEKSIQFIFIISRLSQLKRWALKRNISTYLLPVDSVDATSPLRGVHLIKQMVCSTCEDYLPTNVV